MPIVPTYSCAHAPCICEVEVADHFCSDHCREAAASASDTCACGHLHCAAEPVPIDASLVFA